MRADFSSTAVFSRTVSHDMLCCSQVLWAQDKKQDAIAMLLDRKLWLEAARCQQDAGDPAGAMASLGRIESSHPHFRQACCSLIQIVHDHKVDSKFLDDRLETCINGLFCYCVDPGKQRRIDPVGRQWVSMC